MRRSGLAIVLALGFGALPGVSTAAARDGAATSGAPDPAAPNASAVLGRVKASVRARERPPFVVYTLVRRDAVNGVPDLLNSYRLRIWCRTADAAALSRHVFSGRPIGSAEFIVPVFDGPIDPGPPTADLLDVARGSSGEAAAAPQATAMPTAMPTGLRVIGTIAVFVETNYRVTFGGFLGGDIHLMLEARRDPQHYRLTDLYVDSTTYVIHRAVAHDHLYQDGRAIPERFDIYFGIADGVPIITSIHGQTDYLALDARGTEPLHEVDYQFEDVAFPVQLPGWYFEPALYGAHRSDYPTQ